MTRELREAIKALLEEPTKIQSKLSNLRDAYEQDRDNMTETSKRIEFLQGCLDEGMSKREAARKLVKHDPRVGQRTAETLVYLNFSGMYQTSKRGRRKKATVAVPAQVLPVASIDDDESIL